MADRVVVKLLSAALALAIGLGSLAGPAAAQAPDKVSLRLKLIVDRPSGCHPVHHDGNPLGAQRRIADCPIGGVQDQFVAGARRCS